MKKFNKCSEITVPRSYCNQTRDQCELHKFSGASIATSTVAAYQQLINLKRKHIFVSFAMGKCRVKSLRAQTKSKVELQASVYGT